MIRNRCSRPEYDDIDGVRSSTLKEFVSDDSIESFLSDTNPINQLFIPDPSESSAMLVGTLVHERTLERKRNWAVKPEIDRRTKSGKELYARWEECNADKLPVPQRGVKTCISRQRLVGCSRAVLRLIQSEYGADWRSDALTECAVQWSEHGLTMKALIDLHVAGDLVDLKTLSQWPGEGRFLSHIDKFGYGVQVNHYLAGCRPVGLTPNRFRWLFVESTYPFRARLVDCPVWFLDHFRDTWLDCIKRFKRLAEFVAPREVTLKPEDWWMYKHSEETAQLEGVETYEE